MTQFAFVVPVTELRSAEGFLLSKKCLCTNLKKVYLSGFVYFPIRSECIEFLQENTKKFNGSVKSVHDFFPSKVKRIKSLRIIENQYNVTLPKSFVEIGDCIFINEIQEEFYDKKKIIGEIFLKEFGVRAVFLKKSEFYGEFRIAKWERLAGFGDTFTVHKENNFYFALDLSKVFFNPRMGNERLRVINQVSNSEVIIDMFSGVGPYSIPLAKKKNFVFAFDKNEFAINFLKINMKINNVKERLKPFNRDVRDAPKLIDKKVNRVIMNYPEKAMDFLETVINLPRKEKVIIHFYFFERSADKNKAMKKVVEEIKKRFIIMGVKHVKILYRKVLKEVAPRKYLIVLDILIED